MTGQAHHSIDDGRIDAIVTGPRPLRWVVVVLVVVLVAEIAARGTIGRSPDEIRWYDAAAQQRIELLDARGHESDVVFAGTSAAWQAFVPAEFDAATGTSSLNVGLAGAVPTVMGPWLTDEVASRSSPDLVVWGVTALDFAPAYGTLQERAYDTAVETSDGWLADLDRSVSSVSTLVSSRRVLRSPSELFGSGADRRADDLDAATAITGADGERIAFDVDVTPAGAAIQRSRLDGFEIDGRDVNAIETAIEQLRAAGTAVVLVEVPVPDRFVDALPQPARDLAATRAAIVDIGRSTGSDVILMGDLFGDTSFVDSIHLDADAAAQTTRWLADVLDAPLDPISGDIESGCATVEVSDRIGFVLPVEVCRNATSN